MTYENELVIGRGRVMIEEHVCRLEWGSGSMRRNKSEAVEDRGDDCREAHVDICPSGLLEG